jgi:hypothetical protein
MTKRSSSGEQSRRARKILSPLQRTSLSDEASGVEVTAKLTSR